MISRNTNDGDKTSLISVRQHPSYDDCLEDKIYYHNCSVLYCVTQLSTIIYTLI